MPAKKLIKKKTKRSIAKKVTRKKTSPKRSAPKTRVSFQGGVGVRGSKVTCADLIGRDKKITYGFTAKEVEKLIVKVLEFLKGGAIFASSENSESLHAELNGETLTFREGAIQKLATRRNERSYLLSLITKRDYQMWATKFIPLGAKMDIKRTQEAFDIANSYSEFHVPREGEQGQATFIPLPDITEAVNKHSAFIILGEPGAGKTTTMQKIVFERALALLTNEKNDRLPLFVRLSQQGAHDPFGFLKTEWERRTGSDFDNALAAGRVLILADGVNELGQSERDEKLKAWRLFVNEYAEANQIIFTSRARDYDQQLDLPRVRVDPLDDKRIADYLKRNEAQGLGSLLDDPKTRLREMAQNPFNLSLLVKAYKDDQRGMANRGQLLKWFVDGLFEREKKLAHKNWIHREAQARALAHLAYQMQLQGEGTTFAVKTAKETLPKSVEVSGDDIFINANDLFHLARAATLLDPNIETDNIRFYHHLLQEYFAALELWRRFEAGENLSDLWKCKRTADEMPPATVGEWDPLPEPPSTGWEETTILACGLSVNPSALIEAVRIQNPNLAGRCLDEAGLSQSLILNLKSPIQKDLLSDLYNPKIHLRARLQAGYTLGRIGDPRFEAQTINGVKVVVPMVVNVPAGKYVIGSRDDTQAYEDESPQHTIELTAFAIGKWSVTNAEYACFMDAGGYKDEQWWKTDLAKRWLKGEEVTGGQSATLLENRRIIKSQPDPKTAMEKTGIFSPQEIKAWMELIAMTDDEFKAWIAESFSSKSRERPQFWNDSERNNPSQPVVGITWFEARAYCEWLSAITGKIYRLPSEAEWEASARGAQGRIYPWGNEWDSAKANTIESRVLKPSPVGAYTAAGSAGSFDAEDQAGNVWDWCSTIHKPYPYRKDDEHEDENAEGERIVRGGSWSSDCRGARCASRNRIVPDNFNTTLGFRVLSPAL